MATGLGFVFNGAALSSPEPPDRGSIPILPPIPTASPISSPNRRARQPSTLEEATYDVGDGDEEVGGFDDYDESAGYSGDGDDDAVPDAKMPSQFYSGVEQLLSAAPPSLKTFVRRGGGGPSVEELKRERNELRRQELAGPPAGASKVSSKSRAGAKSGSSAGATGGARKKEFDFNLLAQAMSYTQGLQASGFDDGGGAEEPAGRLAGGSPPRQGNPVSALRRRRDGEGGGTGASGRSRLGESGRGGGGPPPAAGPRAGPSAYGSLKKKGEKGGKGKPKRDGRPQGGRRPSSGGGGGGGGGGTGGFGAGDFGAEGSGEAAVDVNGLVQNFEQGLELARLKAELAASQQRMASSASVLKAAAADFYGAQPKKQGKKR